MLLLALLPWYAHFRATKSSCAGWGCEHSDVVPISGLKVFTFASPVVTLSLLFFFIWIARRRPRSAALFPVIAMILELLALRLLQWNAPAEYTYMNAAADRWLIVSSLAAAVFLASYSWFRRAQPAEVGP